MSCVVFREVAIMVGWLHVRTLKIHWMSGLAELMRARLFVPHTNKHETLAYTLYIREWCCYSPMCTFKNAIKKFE